MIIGLDVGGTHTDVVLLGDNGIERQVKVLTDTSDLFTTVLTGLEKITKDIAPGDITHAVLSTTLTTNAIAQGKLEPSGMIVAGGPGVNPEAFRTSEHYFPVAGSIDHSGKEIEPLDKQEIQKIADQLLSAGIRHVGVVSKFSPRNPAHELEIYDLLKNSFEKIFLGHLVSGNLSFPRRIATTFLNASVYPVHKTFFEAVKKSLKQKGITIPIQILKADGGTMGFGNSIDFPGQTILSGPSASVMGSLAFAPADKEALGLDIGGTTTDMAILINRTPLLAPNGIELGPYKTLIRALSTHSVGIGGDSTVTVVDGRLKIGPQRSGPAMAYGGADPTPTDALFVLGKAKNGDKQQSIKGIQSIADELGVSVKTSANDIFDLSCREIIRHAQEMIDHINSKPVYTVHEALEDYRIKPTHIMILGGPAPFFAERINELSDYHVEKIPEWQVANAIGTALSRTTCEITLFADTQKGTAAAPKEKFSEPVRHNFTLKDTIAMAHDLLKRKAERIGADIKNLETELLEKLEFNMVRDFRLCGKHIRIKLQIRPGLIHNSEAITKQLSASNDKLTPT